jgi:hypothetical protein
MAYSQLSSVTPVVLADRVTNLETSVGTGQTPGLIGTHKYSLGGPPATQTSGTDTVGVAQQIWLTEHVVEKNTLITGISYLIGSVGGTDKAIAILFSASGAVLATSALAGTTVGTAATFQRLAFTTPFQCGPGLYYIGIQTNGTNAHIRTQAGGDHNTGVVSTQTFGTPVAVTPPTSFTTANGPYVMTY